MGFERSARSRWTARAAALGVAACALAAPAGAMAQASDAQLLAAIQSQAPATLSLTSVTPSPDHTRLAILTSAKPAQSAWSRPELWVANEDGSGIAALQSSPYGGGADDYSIVFVEGWSADSSRLLFESDNSAVKPADGPRLVTFDAHGVVANTKIASPAYGASFTADGRYVIYTVPSFGSGSAPYADAAYDIASGTTFTARHVYPTAGGAPSEILYAPECKRAQEPDWVPAQAGGRWMEQALSSPDPGCRFGANANDPGKDSGGDDPVPTASPSPTPTASPTPSATPEPSPSPTPSPSINANDAPPSITQTAQGTGLVPIAERAKPLGPTVRIRSSAKGLTRALRRGLRVKIDLIGAKTLKAYLIVSRPADEELFAAGGGSKDYTVGRLSVKNPPSQTQTISVPFTSAAQAVMPRFLKITVTVRIVADDRLGNRTIVERQVPLTDF